MTLTSAVGLTPSYRWVSNPSATIALNNLKGNERVLRFLPTFFNKTKNTFNINKAISEKFTSRADALYVPYIS